MIPMHARNFTIQEISLKMRKSTLLRSLAIMHAFTSTQLIGAEKRLFPYRSPFIISGIIQVLKERVPCFEVSSLQWSLPSPLSLHPPLLTLPHHQPLLAGAHCQQLPSTTSCHGNHTLSTDWSRRCIQNHVINIFCRLPAHTKVSKSSQLCKTRVTKVVRIV